MKITADDLRRRYAELDTEELIDLLEQGTLSVIAEPILLDELARRGVDVISTVNSYEKNQIYKSNSNKQEIVITKTHNTKGTTPSKSSNIDPWTDEKILPHDKSIKKHSRKTKSENNNQVVTPSDWRKYIFFLSCTTFLLLVSGYSTGGFDSPFKGIFIPIFLAGMLGVFISFGQTLSIIYTYSRGSESSRVRFEGLIWLIVSIGLLGGWWWLGLFRLASDTASVLGTPQYNMITEAGLVVMIRFIALTFSPIILGVCLIWIVFSVIQLISGIPNRVTQTSVSLFYKGFNPPALPSNWKSDIAIGKSLKKDIYRNGVNIKDNEISDDFMALKIEDIILVIRKSNREIVEIETVDKTV